MSTSRKVVTVDKEGARKAAAKAGRKAVNAARQKAGAGTRAAKEKVGSTGKAAAHSIAERAEGARRQLGSSLEKHRNSAVRAAVHTCVTLASKQLSALQKLERALPER